MTKGAGIEAVNISFEAEGGLALLSNLAESPFVLDGQRFNSVEAFIQAIKYPESGPQSAKRGRIALLSGYQAQRAGRNPNRKISASWRRGESVFVYWQSCEIPYRSVAHLVLIERAIRAKFEQSAEALATLTETGDRPIVHDTGKRERRLTSLPSLVLCEMISAIRDNGISSVVARDWERFALKPEPHGGGNHDTSRDRCS